MGTVVGFFRQLLLWALALAPLVYVALPLRTYTQVRVEARDQRGEDIRAGTLFLLDGQGETLDRAPFNPSDGSTAAATYDDPAAVRVVAAACEPFQGPVAGCEDRVLHVSGLSDFLTHGGATFYARACDARVKLTCR